MATYAGSSGNPLRDYRGRPEDRPQIQRVGINTWAEAQDGVLVRNEQSAEIVRDNADRLVDGIDVAHHDVTGSRSADAAIRDFVTKGGVAYFGLTFICDAQERVAHARLDLHWFIDHVDQFFEWG